MIKKWRESWASVDLGGGWWLRFGEEGGAFCVEVKTGAADGSKSVDVHAAHLTAIAEATRWILSQPSTD
jgi:hypothetical protein